MQVTIYTIPTCQFSKAAKEYLTAHNIPYIEKDVEANMENRSEMLAISENFAGVPFTLVSNDDGTQQKLKGFTEEDFAKVFTTTANTISVDSTPQVSDVASVTADQAITTPASPSPDINQIVPEPQSPIASQEVTSTQSAPTAIVTDPLPAAGMPEPAIDLSAPSAMPSASVTDQSIPTNMTPQADSSGQNGIASQGIATGDMSVSAVDTTTMPIVDPLVTPGQLPPMNTQSESNPLWNAAPSVPQGGISEQSPSAPLSGISEQSSPTGFPQDTSGQAGQVPPIPVEPVAQTAPDPVMRPLEPTMPPVSPSPLANPATDTAMPSPTNPGDGMPSSPVVDAAPVAQDAPHIPDFPGK